MAASYTAAMNGGASLAALCVELAVYLDGREPWTDALTALAEASEFDPGDEVPPIELHLDALDGSVAVVAAVRDAASALRWRQNQSYSDTAFLPSYAYSELVGPSGHARHDRYAIGLLYLAPRTFYPAHAHPAEEAYHVLSGASEWWQGEPAGAASAGSAADASALRAPGARVLHPSGVMHAMRSGSRPLLALYIWRGDIGVAAQLAESTERL